MKKIDSICIIDDDPIFVFGARRMIEMANLCKSFMIFKNGKDALENLKPLMQAKRALPQIILLDLNMPIMDGWQFLDEFVKIKSDNPVTIYIVSSSIDPNDLKKVKDYNIVSNYIVKPISSDFIKQLTNEISLI